MLSKTPWYRRIPYISKDKPPFYVFIPRKNGKRKWSVPNGICFVKSKSDPNLDLAESDELRRLMDENAKLRELCADLRFCRRHNCLTCSHGRFCDMKFDERFAKLGIEVE